jgi:hypothetical protein
MRRVWVGGLCSVLLCVVLHVLFSNACWVELVLSFIMCLCRYLWFNSCITSNIGLWVSMYVSCICNPYLLRLYTHMVFLQCITMFSFFSIFTTFIMLVILPYSCPVFHIWFEYLGISPICPPPPPISNEVTNSERSVWCDRFFMAFYKVLFPSVQFHSTDGASGRHNIVTQILHLILCAVFMDLVCWQGLLHTLFTSISILVSGMWMPYRNFYVYFPVISLRHSLVSGIYVTVVILTWVV